MALPCVRALLPSYLRPGTLHMALSALEQSQALAVWLDTIASGLGLGEVGFACLMSLGPSSSNVGR